MSSDINNRLTQFLGVRPKLGKEGYKYTKRERLAFIA